MPRGADTLEREPETGASAPVSSIPPEFLKFMTDMSEKMDAFSAELKEVKSGRSQFRPMNPLARPGGVEQLQIPRDGQPHMDPSRERRIPTLQGARLSPELMAAYPQRFVQGDRVTINPAAERGQVRTETVIRTIERKDHNGNPFNDTKEEKVLIPITWGELLQGLPQLYCPSPAAGSRRCRAVVDPGGACPECGWAPTIASVEFMDERGQWVYKVNFPGISSGARAQAFCDYELEPA